MHNCDNSMFKYFNRLLFYCCKFKEWLTLYFLHKDPRPEYEKYINTYSDNRIIQDKIISPPRVIYRNDWDRTCGIADRLKGILSAYNLARKNNRRFYIYWTKPFPLMRYLEPAAVDWRIKEDEICYTKEKSLPIIIVTRNPYYTQNKIEEQILKHYFRQKKELHVRTNRFLCEDCAHELFNELFRPSKVLQKELDKYLEKQPYYSFSFRFLQLLGDFEDVEGEILQEDKKVHLIDKCLNGLASLLETLPPGYKAFVATDSETFLKRAMRLDSRIFCVDGEIQHPISFFRGNDHNPDVHLKTFLDFFLIMRAEKVYRVQTDQMYASGFPKLAALIGRKPFIAHKF